MAYGQANGYGVAVAGGAVSVTVTEVFAGFSELINVSVPIDITINPRNVIKVKRKNNTIRVSK